MKCFIYFCGMFTWDHPNWSTAPNDLGLHTQQRLVRAHSLTSLSLSYTSTNVTNPKNKKKHLKNFGNQISIDIKFDFHSAEKLRYRWIIFNFPTFFCSSRLRRNCVNILYQLKAVEVEVEVWILNEKR